MVESDNSLSPRARRMAKRREQILDAAAELFAEQGFHRTTTRDIANAADIAEGTLYNYFTNKEDLLLALLGRLGEVRDMELKPAEGLPNAPREYMIHILHQRKENFERNQTVIQSLLSEILVHPELRVKYYEQVVKPSMFVLERSLAERVEDGSLRPHDPRMIARVVTGLVGGLFLLDMLDDPLIDAEWEAISETIADVLLTGLAPCESYEPTGDMAGDHNRQKDSQKDSG